MARVGLPVLPGPILGIPRDVELRNREDLYAYLLSERYWRSFLGRISYMGAGIWFILRALFGFAVLAVKPP